MIFMLSILPESRRADAPVKCPSGALMRTAECDITVEGVQAHVAALWGRFRDGCPDVPAFMQMDILENRKPPGFKDHDRAGTLGKNVVVTRKVRVTA